MVVRGEEKDCVRRYLVNGRALLSGGKWVPAFVVIRDDCEGGYTVEGVSIIKEGGEEEVLEGKVREIYMNGEIETGKFDLLFEMRDKARRYTVIVKFRKWKPRNASVIFD